MENKSIRLAVTLVMFSSLVFSLSCGSSNTNQNQAGTANQPVAEKPTAVVVDPACNEADFVTKVKDRIEADVGGDDELKTRVKVHVRKAGTTPGYLEVLVEGKAYGKDELHDFDEIVKKFMKEKCVLKVVFVPRGTLPLTAPDVPVNGFEWSACEWPKQPCPNGECHESCGGSANANIPVNGGSNSNSNSNPNTNSNTNSYGNSSRPSKP